jgi:hypothetical protein|tara:strand:+ start:555 stop:965 length:411 start_codon:yes stop_codon:yes gene_type:complete
MNKADLKKIIKPVVKECIHEVLLEEGLLSNVVAEVAKGMRGNLMVETITPAPVERIPVNASKKSTRKKINEHRAKLISSIDKDAYNGVNLFEGTEPMSPRDASPQSGRVDLGDPNDAGVDISSLMSPVSKIWKAMK